jgi:hypothetical protein
VILSHRIPLKIVPVDRIVVKLKKILAGIKKNIIFFVELYHSGIEVIKTALAVNLGCFSRKKLL